MVGCALCVNSRRVLFVLAGRIDTSAIGLKHNCQTRESGSTRGWGGGGGGGGGGGAEYSNATAKEES